MNNTAPKRKLGIIIPFPRPSLRTFTAEGVEYCTRADAVTWLRQRGHEVATGDGQALVVGGRVIDAVFVNGHGLCYPADEVKA